MRTSTIFWLAVVLVLIGIAAYFALAPMPSLPNAPSQTLGTASTTTNFYCAGNKRITATFGQGIVSLALSDGRTLTLAQTVSGSGIRYEATSTTSGLVFTSEGSSAQLTEHNHPTYSTCLAGIVASSPGATGYHTFTDRSHTFMFTFPDAFSIVGTEPGYTNSWAVNATSTGLLLAAVAVPSNLEPKTNFADARFTVGTSADPQAVLQCLLPLNGAVSQGTTSIHGIAYAVFLENDAGAGNIYHTESYRTIRSKQCYAIEYTIHSGNIGNYPAGAVKPFDQAKIENLLKGIVGSFRFL